MSDTNDMPEDFVSWVVSGSSSIPAGTRWNSEIVQSHLSAWKAATERATQLEPVAVIDGIDAYGPRIGWLTHWVKVGVGTKLYAAPCPAIRQGGAHD